MSDAPTDDLPAAAALLDYASPPVVGEPWGPILFRPSRRSLALLIPLVLAAAWLAARHAPWRCVGTIRADQPLAFAFTRDNLLLTFDARDGVNLHDPATARRLRNVLPSLDAANARYLPLAGGEQILALPYVDPVAAVYDVASGRLIRHLPNPDGLGTRLVAIAPDGPRLVTARTAGLAAPGMNGHVGWDIGRPDGRPRPVRLRERAYFTSVEFSPDGARLLGIVSNAPSGFALYDAVTFGMITWHPAPDGSFFTSGGFAGGGRFWVTRYEPNGPLASGMTFELRSSLTGEVIRSVPLAPAVLGLVDSQLVVSADAARAGTRYVGPTSPGRLDFVEVVDLESGRTVGTRHATHPRPVAFFPRSDRLLAANDTTNELAVLDPRHDQPVAVIPTGVLGRSVRPPEISPDGRTLVVSDRAPVASVAIYRPTGWDCPESHLGALAFPQTWLTTVLFPLLAISLTLDARRARSGLARQPVSAAVVVGLLVVTIPLTAHALLAALVGQWTRTPAPVVLILAILLATHARVWRAASVLALCGMIPLLAWYGHVLRRGGLWGSVPFDALDRVYVVPVRVPLAAVAGLMLLVLAGLYLLLRPRARLA